MCFPVQNISPETLEIEIGEEFRYNNTAEFTSLHREHMRKGVRNFLLNFGHTEFFDSAAVGAVLSLYRRLSRHSGTAGIVAFINMRHQRVREVYEIDQRLDKFFHEFQTVEEALRKLRLDVPN